MSWHYLQALVEESSDPSCSATESSAPWSKSRTAGKSCCGARGTVCSPCFRSGTTCAPSTADPGVERWISSLGASPARTCPPPGRVQESPAEPAPASGRSSLGSFARWDPSGCSWRTPQCSLVGGSMLFSGIWPRSGSMRSGTCSGRATSAPHIAATGSGFLPTPTAQEYGSRNNGCPRDGRREEYRTKGAPSLSTMARRNQWPTPTVACATGGQTSRSGKRKGELLLAGAVRAWPTSTKSDSASSGSRNTPGSKAHLGLSLTDAARGDGGGGRTILRTGATPTGQDAHNNGNKSQSARNYPSTNAQVGGALSPLWVEWLMGVPIAWTDLQPLAMLRFRSWLRLHSENLRDGLLVADRQGGSDAD